jgi:RimJ/RimL family protein N-acetyltransferase
MRPPRTRVRRNEEPAIDLRALRGTDVTLEPQVAAHAAELYAAIADPELYRFTDDKEPASEAWLRARLARLESRRSPDGAEHWLNWVVRTKAGLVAGYVQATVTPDGDAEIAYVLARPFQRQGIGFAAVTLMLDELAGAYGAIRAWATLDPDNAASLALLRKLGFRFVSEDAVAHEVRYRRDLAGTHP